MSTAPLKPGARGPSSSSGPQIEPHEVLDHQRHAEGREQLEQLRRVVDAAQQRHFDERADARRPRGRRAAPPPEAEKRAEPVDRGIGDIGAQHVEGAMREIHDARDAEDDRQAGGDEEQRAGAGEPGEELGEVEAHVREPARRFAVMAGLVPAIHAATQLARFRLAAASVGASLIHPGADAAHPGVDGRDKPGHDGAAEQPFGRLTPSAAAPSPRFRRQVVRAVVIDEVGHHALAVLQRGLADEGAERRLMVDRAERHLAERRVELQPLGGGDQLVGVGRMRLGEDRRGGLDRANSRRPSRAADSRCISPDRPSGRRRARACGRSHQG